MLIMSGWQDFHFSELIELCEFFRQIIDVIRGIEFAASVFKENGRLIEASVAVDMLCEPCFHVGKIAEENFFFHVRNIFFHEMQHLRAVCAAERIGGEISEAAA